MKVWPMFCKACGQSIDRGDRFCRNCGLALAQEPFEAAVSAGASTKSGETPLVVATSTAELQRPLPIPKNKLLEADSGVAAAAGEGKAAATEAPREDAVKSAVEPQFAPAAAAAQPVPERQAVIGTARPSNSPSKADNAAAAGSGPVRLCPQCHRLVGDDDLYCERCKAKLTPSAVAEPVAASASADYGVPSFAGYAEKPDKRESASTALAVAADPSGVDAISNLRQPRRRRLPFVEALVAVILLGGAGFAVWMLRSELPGKTATQSGNVDVTISPARAKVSAGHGYDLAATVTGTDNYNVDWSVDEGDGGGRIVPRGAKAKDGAVSSLAVYMAPKTPGTYHVTATSKADPGKSASAMITVTK